MVMASESGCRTAAKGENRVPSSRGWLRPRNSHVYLLVPLLLAGMAWRGSGWFPSSHPTPGNAVVSENRRKGAPNWISAVARREIELSLQGEFGPPPTPGKRDISSSGALVGPVSNAAPAVEGYANRQSVNTGEPISFSTSSTVATYDLVVYRVGWYGGAGAAEITRRSGLSGAPYPKPAADALGTITCTWPIAASFDTTGWTSGFYVAAFVAPGAAPVVGYAPFVVRNDADTAAFLMQIPLNTYEAYNQWGGKSLYDDNSVGGRARKVSFDRPYGYGQGTMSLFSGDYQMIQFLERNGYNVSYAASYDMHTKPGLMNNHKGFLTSFHDEYWSYEMRQNLVNNIAGGKSAAFFSANNLYWQVRFEDGGRTMVGYKGFDDPYNYVGNPLRNRTTYLFRSEPINLPEEDVLGARYENYFPTNGSADWVVTNSAHWIYAGTGLANGSHIPAIVGYEWDRANAGVPADGTGLSNGDVLIGSVLYQHNAVIRQKTSGAIVFNASTTSFARYLDIGNATVERMASNLLNRIAGAIPPATTPATTPTTTLTTTPTTVAPAPTITTTTPPLVFVPRTAAPAAPVSGPTPPRVSAPPAAVTGSSPPRSPAPSA